MMFDLAELEAVHGLVLRHMSPTPAHRWPLLSERLGAEVIVKHENHAPTGAFKVRGGLVHLTRLRNGRADCPGVISATRGNHGQSLALAGAAVGLPVTIVVPLGNSTEKNAAMRAFGAELIEFGEDFEAARQEAGRLAATRGLTMVPSFHRDLVLGVATYSLELFRAQPNLDVLYVPIGMGSGVCGAILARDLLGLNCEIVGVQSTGAPSYALSLAAGQVVSTPMAITQADGMATRVPDETAFAVIRSGVSRIVTVSDDDIGAAIRTYWTDTHNLAEGAGAAPLAAALKDREVNAGKRVGLVLSGGNIDLSLFREWVLCVPAAA
jgi:threonine dehydratase